MRCKGMAALAAGVLWFGSAHAATLEVEINDQRGHPVSDAVVTLLPAANVHLAPAPASTTPRFIDQRRLVFMPYVEVFHPGERVVFRNSDDTRHHVYSFSAPKAFEFVVAPRTHSAPLVLDKSGVVAVGCNIHDGMISYLYVTDAPRAARTDANGRVSIDALPAGKYEVRVWHPRLPPGRPDLRERATTIVEGETKTLAFPLTLRPDQRKQFDREHTHY